MSPMFFLFPALTQRSRKFCAMTEGDVNYVTAIGRQVIVLNSFQVARNLLEKRSGIYSGRPRLVMMAELCACFFSLHLNHLGSNLSP